MFFPEATIKEWRRNARQAWAARFPADTPDGWSVSPVDLSRVVAVFPALKVKEGLALRAYQYRQRRDGHSLVFAVPAGESLPAVKSQSDKPARPPAALEDFMQAVEGDGSLESYLQASVLRRELCEFGALGHGSDWALYHVLGEAVWSEPPLPAVSPEQTRPSGTPDMWQWKAPQPKDYRPAARQKDSLVNVVFYVYSALGQERIIRHEDVFHAGSYVFQTLSQTIAVGPGSYLI